MAGKEESKVSKVSFEKALAQLQTTVQKLESGELSLEDSLKSFEEGIRLTRTCQTHLEEAEKRIQKLTQKNGHTELTDFDETMK